MNFVRVSEGAVLGVSGTTVVRMSVRPYVVLALDHAVPPIFVFQPVTFERFGHEMADTVWHTIVSYCSY